LNVVRAARHALYDIRGPTKTNSHKQGGVAMPAMPFVGQIMPFAGTTVPRGWALCAGQILAITTNQALFSLIGTTYGGNGVSTFGLPDLRGRAILGSGNDFFGNNYTPGQTGGEIAVTLLTAHLPSHNHLVNASTTAGAGRVTVPPTNKFFAVNTDPADNPKKIFLTAGTAETNLAPMTNVMSDGGGVPHNNMQPYLTINYMIALQGIFPSRS
jgi:microcystin-dependent protein